MFVKYLNPFFLFRKRRMFPVYARSYVHDARLALRARVNRVRASLAIRGLGLSEDDRHMARLKDVHRGRRAFIIGNGPSLKIADLERLSSEITFASNRIYVCFGDTTWRPTYYLTSYLDEIHEGLYRDIEAFSGSVKFLPAAARKRCRPVAGAIHYRREQHDFYPDKPLFSSNALETVYWGGTVTYELIQLACYMGIREMYLLGVDFSYKAPEAANCSDGRYTSVRDVDHFHPDYLKPNEKAGAPLLHLHARAYEKAREAVESLGGHVFNATRGGHLEVLERADLDRVLGG